MKDKPAYVRAAPLALPRVSTLPNAENPSARAAHTICSIFSLAMRAYPRKRVKRPSI